MRFTKIVATIGPATNSPEQIEHLMKSGVNVFRLNFSHGDHVYHGASIKTIIRLRKKLGVPAAIMLDTKGPEIRTGTVKAPILIRHGEQVLFTHKKNVKSSRTVIQVSHAGFAKDAKNARAIIVDNGTMEFHIDAFTKDGVLATTKDEATVTSKRHVNLPGAHVSLPTFTKTDWEDISFGIKMGVDFIAPSFIRSGKDIRTLQAFLKRKKSKAMIIAKIETEQAVEEIDDIIAATDGVMVARGDLGSEIPFEKVPRIQDDIVQACIRSGKAVIVATQMLESMIENPMPTRAEVTDVAHAAATFADATMLSGETASGEYPFKAVSAMHRILLKTESSALHRKGFLDQESSHPDSPRVQQASAACLMAKNIGAKAIVVITKTGNTARTVARFRPEVPILAFTDAPETFHQLSLTWGVHSFTIPVTQDFDKTVESALALLKKEKIVSSGMSLIIVSDIRTNRKAPPVMTVQIRNI